MRTVNHLASNQRQRTIPLERSSNNAVLELQREDVPALRRSTNLIQRDITDTQAQNEEIRRLLARSLDLNEACCDELRSGQNRIVLSIENNL